MDKDIAALVKRLRQSQERGVDFLIDDTITALEHLSKQLDERNAQIVGLREALQLLHDNTADYITINNLGDPWHNSDMQMARKALASTPATALASLRAKCFEEAAKVCDTVAKAKANSPLWMKYDEVTGGYLASELRRLANQENKDETH